MSIFGIVMPGFSIVDCNAALPTVAIFEDGSTLDYGVVEVVSSRGVTYPFCSSLTPYLLLLPIFLGSSSDDYENILFRKDVRKLFLNCMKLVSFNPWFCLIVFKVSSAYKNFRNLLNVW